MPAAFGRSMESLPDEVRSEVDPKVVDLVWDVVTSWSGARGLQDGPGDAADPRVGKRGKGSLAPLHVGVHDGHAGVRDAGNGGPNIFPAPPKRGVHGGRVLDPLAALVPDPGEAVSLFENRAPDTVSFLEGRPLGAGAAEGSVGPMIGCHSPFMSEQGCPSASLSRSERFAHATESLEPDFE
eukprot:16434086-Heterocapsa_arctica.AAC.1